MRDYGGVRLEMKRGTEALLWDTTKGSASNGLIVRKRAGAGDAQRWRPAALSLSRTLPDSVVVLFSSSPFVVVTDVSVNVSACL